MAETINNMTSTLATFADQVTRVAREVGVEGRLGGQANVPGAAGTWKDLTDNVNLLAANLTTQVRNIAEVTTAVARGDLSRKITVDVKGEILELKNTINTMVDQLNAFASEVTRVAREVGTEGKLGGQAQVSGVAGTWKDLTDTVNVMAANLTEQVRGIVKVVTAVAMGDLKQSLTVMSKGEVAALAETINNMTSTLAIFADQVTTVAREVGVEGRFGGQANVPGAAGTWKDLTGNVNLLAANLTTQVRAIAEVATAVTKGDLTRSIQVEARGEVAELKDNINTMIDNLRLTTERNTEQDWLKTNLARVTNMLQGQRDLATVGRMLLTELAPLVNAQNGVIYLVEDSDGTQSLRLLSTYADEEARPSRAAAAGRGPHRPMRRRCAAHADDRDAAERRADHLRPLQGDAEQRDRAAGAVRRPGEGGDRARLARHLHRSADPLPRAAHRRHRHRLEHDRGDDADRGAAEAVAAARRRIADAPARAAADQRAARAEGAAARRAATSRSSARTRKSSRRARALEEKATELALTSKYKSEFLANMSHELRTPLNSILILGQQLADNPDANLSAKQVDFARTIHGAGTDLLNLISDILDLSKIELGTVSVDAEEVFFTNLQDVVARPFRHEADSRNLLVRRADRSEARPQHGHRFEAPAAGAEEPAVERLQIHRHRAACGSSITQATADGAPDHPVLRNAPAVVAFEVADSGIGIPPEKQRIIFEAFQQADASDQPQIWRHRPRPRHQPRARDLARRRNPAPQHARRGQHVHALSAGQILGSVRAAEGGLGHERAAGAAQRAEHRAPAGSADRNRCRTTAPGSSRATRCCSSSRTIRIMPASPPTSRTMPASRC